MYVTNRVGEIKAMNDNDFKAFINDESWELNKKTIEAMMEKELERMFKKSMLILLMLV